MLFTKRQTTKSFYLVAMGGVLALSQFFTSTEVLAAPSNKATLNTLSSFLTQLKRKHPQLKISQAELEAANARARAASKSLYNPELDFDIERTGFNRNKVDTVTVGLNQTIDWHDKRAARRNIATTEQQLSQYNKAENHQQLVAGIFSALANYHSQREILQASMQRLSIIKKLLSQAIRRYSAGDISKLDLEQIRLNLSKSQLTVNLIKTQLVAKQQALVAKAGEARKVWPTLPYAPPVIQPEKIQYEKMLLNLPMYKAEEIRVAIARSTLKLRVREQKPDPTIGLRAGGEESNKMIGLTLSIPLNIRNNYRAEVDEARANIRRAESTLVNSKYHLRSRLVLAAQTYQLSYSSWKTWQKMTSKSLKKQSFLLLRLWKAGELSTSEYLLQLDQIREAEMNHIELKGNVWKAWFNWLAVSNQFEEWLSGSIK